MTANELIKELEKFDGSMEVIVDYGGGASTGGLVEVYNGGDWNKLDDGKVVIIVI